MQQIEDQTQYKKAPHLERFFICNSKMVQQVDSRWNQVYASLMLMYEKLNKFGFVHNCETVIFELNAQQDAIISNKDNR